MHPAGSIILFTTASGVGYGLMVLAVGADLAGVTSNTALLAAAIGIGLALVTAGLLSSLAHLGHPERAWRALSQWRSSWLSREGLCAIATFGPVCAYLGYRLEVGAVAGAALFAVGGLAMAGCLATIYCTAMIYASLKPIHAWHTPLVPSAYLVLGTMGGSVTLALLVHATGGAVLAASIASWVLLAVGAFVKVRYWRRQARESGPSTTESATGLGALGRVRQWEAPHSHDNYLLKEMGYRLARERADILRPLAMLSAFVLPAVLILVALFLPQIGAIVLAALAVASVCAGLAIERWLFFAEAKHAVTLYYEGGDPVRV